MNSTDGRSKASLRSATFFKKCLYSFDSQFCRLSGNLDCRATTQTTMPWRRPKEMRWEIVSAARRAEAASTNERYLYHVGSPGDPVRDLIFIYFWRGFPNAYKTKVSSVLINIQRQKWVRWMIGFDFHGGSSYNGSKVNILSSKQTISSVKSQLLDI